jgi:maltooligosyltrehalose trehalohydrolase
MRVNQTRERQSYYSMFCGSTAEIAQTLRQGWLYCGQASPFHKKPRGTPCDDFSPEHIVYCISNHDQVGNRLFGDRLHHSISPAAYRAFSLFLCLVPYTPLIFMGQEWGTNSPFLYFVDMPDELGLKIADGRKNELLKTNFVPDPGDVKKMPDPNSPSTFFRSKLNWDEIVKDEHRRLFDLYRLGLKLRVELFGRRNPPRTCWQVEAKESAVILHYQLGSQRVDVRLCLQTRRMDTMEEANVLLRSNAPEFTGVATGEGPETIVINV